MHACMQVVKQAQDFIRSQQAAQNSMSQVVNASLWKCGMLSGEERPTGGEERAECHCRSCLRPLPFRLHPLTHCLQTCGLTSGPLNNTLCEEISRFHSELDGELKSLLHHLGFDARDSTSLLAGKEKGTYCLVAQKAAL
jgi:hypothetical protein